VSEFKEGGLETGKKGELGSVQKIAVKMILE